MAGGGSIHPRGPLKVVVCRRTVGQECFEVGQGFGLTVDSFPHQGEANMARCSHFSMTQRSVQNSALMYSQINGQLIQSSFQSSARMNSFHQPQRNTLSTLSML